MDTITTVVGNRSARQLRWLSSTCKTKEDYNLIRQKTTNWFGMMNKGGKLRNLVGESGRWGSCNLATSLCCFCLMFALPLAAQQIEQPNTSLLVPVEVTKIWDKAPHNAFTDLLRYRDRWFCVFREGAAHVSNDGRLRVLVSEDGDHWKSAALLTCSDADLRDAKLTVMPAGQLMLSGAKAMHDRSTHSHQSVAWFSDDGISWADPYEIGDPDFWLWRTTWHRGVAYSIGYSCTTDRSIRLYASSDGKKFNPIVERLFDDGYPNETAIVFDNDSAYCLLRRDGIPSSAMFGTARDPFLEWNWRDLGVRIGGPQLVRLPDGRLVAAVRLYEPRVRTALCWLDPNAGNLVEFLELPSGGDTSYAGLVWHDDRLWVSYYSSHEEKASIYLAKVQIPLESNQAKGTSRK